MNIENFFSKYEEIILKIKTRLYFLNSLENELNKATKNKPFRIKNDISYRIIMDIWDMLVIDFSSLLKGMYEKGGFFKQIKSNLDKFKCETKKKIKGSNSHINCITLYEREEQYYKLFPELRNRKIKKINAKDTQTTLKSEKFACSRI